MPTRIKSSRSSAVATPGNLLAPAKSRVSAEERIKLLQQRLEKQEQEFKEQSAELRRVNRALRTLSGGNRSLLAAQTEMELFESVCKVIVERSGFIAAWVGYGLHDSQKTFQVVVSAGAGADYIKECPIRWDDSVYGTGPSGQAVRTGKPALKQDLATDSSVAVWLNDMSKEGFAAALGLPLFLDGKVLGALVIIARDPQAFDGGALELFEEMAADVSFGIAVIRDREVKQRHEEKIHWMAYHHKETSLPNRMAFLEFLDRHLEKLREEHHPMAVLTLYAQETAIMTDVLSAKNLSAILRKTAKRIQSHLHPDYFLALCADDRLAIAMPGSNIEQALAMADSIQTLLQKPTSIGKVDIDISPIMGIAVFPGHALNSEGLLRSAEVALRVARQRGALCEVFHPSFEKESRSSLKIAGGIRAGLKKQEFSLYYQPKIDLQSGNVLGAEALLRWIHPTQGVVGPGSFIPVAEKTGLIKPLTDWVVQEAMRQTFKLFRRGTDHRIAINMCARSFFDPALRLQLVRSLATWGVEPEDIMLELTESMLAENTDLAVKILHDLRDMGISISIDDFGTGYSSLSCLQLFPVNEIKLDYSFIRAATRDPVSLSIARAVVTLGRDLGRKIVAEGVEDEETAILMREVGCDTAQGYFFGRPMPENVYVPWLKDWPKSAAYKALWDVQ
ncbi:MAG: bifunctional diguanylate cyclase/phosphodiesterase [Acidobacteriaceae bacterium]